MVALKALMVAEKVFELKRPGGVCKLGTWIVR